MSFKYKLNSNRETLLDSRVGSQTAGGWGVGGRATSPAASFICISTCVPASTSSAGKSTHSAQTVLSSAFDRKAVASAKWDNGLTETIFQA